VTDQSGERLARSACPRCDSSNLFRWVREGYWSPLAVLCGDCHEVSGVEQVYEHGLALDEKEIGN